ncbi:MAG: hypothetical protein ACYC5H_15160 [Methylovirgula sp.]
MSEQQTRDEEIKSELVAKSGELEKMSDFIVRAAEGRRPMPTSLGDSLKNIADLTGSCEEALAEHLDAPLAGDTLSALADAIKAIHNGIDSLIVFQALDGAAYNTITVAND